jgi:phospholipase/carboxylesterase
MPATTSHATAEHPVEGFRSVVLPFAPNRPLRVYLPTDYQPKYAYPLVALFHASGESEEHAARLVPFLSRRNYVAVCIRGSVSLGSRADGRPAFGWAEKSDRGAKAALTHSLATYSVNPDHVYLVGVGEGVSAAYRLALSRRDRVAGVVALNGTLPQNDIPANSLRVLIAHGTANPVVPLAEVRVATARLTASGAAVRLNRYAGAHRVHADMLRDANHWIMSQVTGKREASE